MSRSKPKKRSRFAKAMRAIWSICAFFALAYFPTVILGGDGRASMVACAMLAIPFGATATSVRWGVIRGAVLGLVAGMSMGGAMSAVYDRPAPPLLMATCASMQLGAATLDAGMTFRATVATCTFLTGDYGHPVPPIRTATYVITTTVMCTATAWGFAVLGRRRQQHLSQQ